MQTIKKTRVLIVGGGFGGVKTALELVKNSRLDITLISDSDTFHYYPTLYHTATGGTVNQSSIPLSRIFKGKSVRFIQGHATAINRKKKILTLKDDSKIPYDIIVLALGSVPNYFGIQGIEEFSYSITTPANARRLKQHLHQQLMTHGKPDLNYVIVGGGPTGIELAGSLTDYLARIMKAHGIKNEGIHIDLIEAAPKLIPRMPDRMSAAITKRLRKLGVNVYLGHTVQGQTADQITVNGRPIKSHTVVWNAGTKLNSFYESNDFNISQRGKVAVDEYLLAGQDIYVIGDNAATEFSGLAQTALHDATYVADAIQRQLSAQLLKPYKPKRPIYVIPVGKNWAAVLWGKQQIYGVLGWLLRLAADFVGYKDYEPWWRASKQWMTEFQSEEDCTICELRADQTITKTPKT